MTYIILFFSLVLAAVIQAVVPSFPVLGDAKLPVLLGVVMYYALTRSRKPMLVAAFLAGLFQDTLSMVPLGYSSFAFCIAGAVVNQYRELLFVHQFITHVLFGAIVNLSMTLLMYTLLLAGGHAGFAGGWILLKAGGSLFLGALVVPIVFYLTRGLEEYLGHYPLRES